MQGVAVVDLRDRTLVADANPLVVIVLLFIVWAGS